MTYARVDFTTYVVISIWFGCNNDCSICMLGDLKRRMSGIAREEYLRLLTEIRSRGQHENLILSGAEVTTFEGLEGYVEDAARLGWFKRLQIQTNGRRLAEPGYAARLVARGLNEFFVSVQGLEPTHDRVTRRAGAFRETMAGLKTVAALHTNVISATVLTRESLPDVPELVSRLVGEGVGELQLWNFFPMEPTDTRDLVVRVPELLRMLEGLRPILLRAGKPLVLKGFPQCLAPEAPIFFDSLFPATVLPQLFWHQFSQSGWGGCVWRDAGRCRSQECWGLSKAYLAKYGDERALLTPLG
jgi:MoaA/NifB/PqqE/SkfB family radical SAM enzyme